MKTDIVDAFRRELGDSLRGIILGSTKYEVLYTRDESYFTCSDEHLNTIYDEFRASHLARDHKENIWNSGEFRCEIKGFEEFFSCQIMVGDIDVIIWFDYDIDINLENLVDIGERVATQVEDSSTAEASV
jgi:hypothetical protein